MKSFIITLLESNLSKKLSTECIDAANQHGITVEAWPAVNGYTDGHEKLKKYNIRDFFTFKNYPGVIGCFLSHYELWIECTKRNEPILILEHDGYPIRSLPDNIDDMYSDVLYLDPFKPTEPEYEDNIVASLISDTIGTYYPDATGTDRSGDFVVGAYGYCIKPHAAKKLIDFAVEVGANPADVHIGRDIVDLKSTTETVVRLHNFYNNEHIHKYSSTAYLQRFLKNDS